VRIVDLETKSYTNSSRPATISRRTESRIEELTNQLNQSNKEKNRRRDSGLQSAEPDRLRARLEEERAAYESQIGSLRRDMDAMVIDLYPT
jgi:myosin protein heavy chain